MAPRTRKAAAAAAATGPPGKKPAASTSSLPSSLSSSLSSRPSVASLAPGKAAPAAGANGGVGCLASSVVDGKRKSQFEDRLVRWLSGRSKRRRRKSSPGRGNVAPAAAGRPRRRRPCCVFLAVAAILYACWLAAVRRVSGALEPLLEETGGRLQLELVAEKVVLPAAKDYLPQLVYDRFEAATRTVLARSRDWTAQSAFFLGLSKKEGGLLYSSPETIFQRGLHMKQEEGITAKHPLLLIPGIISTGLESWSVHPCAQKYFRARLWGTMNMFRAMVLDKECWLSHMKLDPLTGLDPEGVKLRASQGLEAADYLVPGYWVWAVIISQAASVGYDNNNMHLAAYDWRLSHPLLQKRDLYFTKLKNTIEMTVKSENGSKAVLVAHSMGANVVLYFFKWVESELGGNGGPRWVNDHIEAFVNLGGPLLGCPKTVAALLSGEMRDTAQMGAFTSLISETLLSKQERAELFRSWGGLVSMLPKGGDAVWGDEVSAPDDIELTRKNDGDGSFRPLDDIGHQADPRPSQNNSEVRIRSGTSWKNSTSAQHSQRAARPQRQQSGSTYGTLLTFARPPGDQRQLDAEPSTNLTASGALELILSSSPDWFGKSMNEHYSFQHTTSPEELEKAEKEPRRWTNPLESRLPFAPDMRIVCMYGVGKPTERKYVYRHDRDEGRGVSSLGRAFKLFAMADPGQGGAGQCGTSNASESCGSGERRDPPARPFLVIDTSYSSSEHIASSGVHTSEGDGTVPLISLSYMCTSGWRKKLYNPGGSPVVVREYVDRPTPRLTDFRGSDRSGDHVDMLGNQEVMKDVLRVAAGHGHLLEDRVHSLAYEYAEDVDRRLFGGNTPLS